MAEIEHLVEQYGAREITFWDDTMTLNKRWMYELCDRLGLPVVSGEGAVRMTCNAHSPNEHVFLEDWFRAIKQFAAFLDVYARS